MKKSLLRAKEWSCAPWLRMASLALIAIFCLARTAWPCTPAGLSMDSCLGQLSCVRSTNWDLKKVPLTPALSNPLNTAYSFDVIVTEGATDSILKGSGRIVLTNSGNTTAYISSICLNMEKATQSSWCYYGSSTTWSIVATALQNAPGVPGNVARTTLGDMKATAGCTLTLIDPRTNKPLALGGKLPIPPTTCGQGPVTINFTFSFKLASLSGYGNPFGDCSTCYWADGGRFNAIVTYLAGGASYGSTCLDVNFDGKKENYVCSIQDRSDYSSVNCTDWTNRTVKVTDTGAVSDNPLGLTITTNKLSQVIKAAGAGTTHHYTVGGTASFIPRNISLLQSYLDSLGGGNPIGLDIGTPAALSYLTGTLRNANGLSGTHAAWCLDPYSDIYSVTPYDVQLISSYDADAAALLSTLKGVAAPGQYAHADNLDLVNWILNQNYVGKSSPSKTGPYSVSDVQEAIWCVLHDRAPQAGDFTPALDGNDLVRIQEITTAAASHKGFVPGLGQDVAVLVWVTGGPYYYGTEQLTMIQIPVCNGAALIANTATLTNYDSCTNTCTSGCTGSWYNTWCNPCYNTCYSKCCSGCYCFWSCFWSCCWYGGSSGVSTNCTTPNPTVLATATARINVNCNGGAQPAVKAGDYITFAQSDYVSMSADPANPLVTLLGSQFAVLFPTNAYASGFALGDQTGNSANSLYAIKLSSGAAVWAYLALPATGASNVLTGDATDPTAASPAGDFGQTLAAAKLNVAFDACGATRGNYIAGSLGTLYFSDADSPYYGMTVNEVIALADVSISDPAAAVTAADLSKLNAALKQFNGNFAFGVNGGHLAFPLQ